MKRAQKKAAEYAARVWQGQSPNLPTKERIARVLKALEAQGLSTEGLTFPPVLKDA